MSMQSSNNTITLPPGWSISPPKETSRQAVGGGVQQGVLFTLTNISGGNTSVFVPYQLLPNTTAVQALILSRIQQIEAITGATSGS
jgi:hypothetical protein